MVTRLQQRPVFKRRITAVYVILYCVVLYFKSGRRFVSLFTGNGNFLRAKAIVMLLIIVVLNILSETTGDKNNKISGRLYYG